MPPIATSTLDALLTVQLNLAWAGEHDCEPARRGWWKANLSDPEAGGYFVKTLAPRTWAWSALIALREAGRRADVAAAGEDRRSDRFSSIFRIDPRTDQRLDERLRDLRAEGKAPHDALPDLLFSLTDDPDDSAFDEATFTGWLDSLPPATGTPTPAGLRLQGAAPADPLLRTQKLARLLRTWDEPAWPAPHAVVEGSSW